MSVLPSWAQVGTERRAHIDRVAALLSSWAAAMGTPPPERERWLRAAHLHDALRDAPLRTLEEMAREPWASADLLHGPAAAVMAARHGETDAGVLDAVRFHSVGYAGWDVAGRMLYLADYLEPGRSFRAAERRRLADQVPTDPDGTLRTVAAERLCRTVSSGWPLPRETVDFWNGLVRSG